MNISPSSNHQKFFASSFDYAIIVLCGLFFCVGVFSLNEISIYTPDSTRYLVWAKSLSDMMGFYDGTMPEASRYVVHAPLYPLLLAPVSFFFPQSILAPKIITLLIGTIALFFLYRWMRSFIHSGIAFLGCAALAVNPLYFLYSTEVLSDVPFVLSLILVCILVSKITSAGDFRLRDVTALALSVAAALLLREIGISVLIAAVLFLVFGKKYKEAGFVFIIPVVIYGAWYVRNELVVAALEQPVLTNSKIFSYHFFTPADATLAQEFMARITNNAEVYAKLIGDLLLFPMYFSPQYDLVAPSEPMVSFVKGILLYGKYPVFILLFSSFVYGVITDVRRSGTGLFHVLFIALYIGVMLFYPINDIRFLLPLIVIAVYYFVCGITQFSVSRIIAIPFAGVLLLPNIVWGYSFVRNSHDYASHPVEFYESGRSEKDYPTHFTKPFRLAGGWIQSHTPPQSVLISQWKDLAFWIGERKLLNVDQTIAPDEFENLIRDYGITFLVSQVKRGEISEFAFQVHHARRYEFTLQHRVGNTEVYEITRRKNSGQPESNISRFEESLRALDEERYDAAETILDCLWRDNNRNLTALFYLATAKECGGKLIEADSLFEFMREHPQAGIFLGKAGTHRQIIRQLKLVAQDSSSTGKAEKLLAVGAGYWNMGLRTQGKSSVSQALKADSRFANALIFQTLFALKEGDTILAVKTARELESVHPGHPVSSVFNRMFSIFDSVSVVSDTSKRSDYFFQLAEQYLALGLTEDAVDCGLLSLESNRANSQTLVLLADIYIKKRRFAPAKKALQHALEIDPLQENARLLLSEAMQH